MAVAGQTVAFEALTVDNTAGGVGFNTTKLALIGTKGKVVCRLETAEIRFTTDSANTTVTSAVGMLLEIGETLEITGYADAAAFRAIRTGGSSGALKCHYVYGGG